jgi:hypothetical protein
MKIERPQADSKKISSKDDFELCYLRHQYLRRVDYNPTAAEMAPYNKIVSIQARKTFYAYANLFKLVGMELEDLNSIGHVHLVSFLGLYSFRVPEKLREFVVAQVIKTGKLPPAWVQDAKNKANLTLFLKQRMQDVVRICQQKARNIKGQPTEEFYVFYGPKRPPKNPRELIDNYEKMGFRKLDIASFKTIRKRVMKLDDEDAITKTGNQEKPFEILKFAGSYYISVPLDHRDLTVHDFAGADMDPYDSIHNKNPEQLYLEQADQEQFEEKKANFDSQSTKRKETIIRHFIRKHKGDPRFKEELQTARKFLKELRANAE